MRPFLEAHVPELTVEASPSGWDVRIPAPPPPVAITPPPPKAATASPPKAATPPGPAPAPLPDPVMAAKRPAGVAPAPAAVPAAPVSESPAITAADIARLRTDLHSLLGRRNPSNMAEIGTVIEGRHPRIHATRLARGKKLRVFLAEHLPELTLRPGEHDIDVLQTGLAWAVLAALARLLPYSQLRHGG